MSTRNASSFGRARPHVKPSARAESSALLPVVRIAGVQLASGPNVAANLNEARRLIGMAVAQGAKLVALPEYFAIMGMHERDKVSVREEEGKGPIQAFLAETAKKNGIWIVGGSVPLVSTDPGRVRNSCTSTTIRAGWSPATTRSTCSASRWARSSIPRSAPSSQAAK